MNNEKMETCPICKLNDDQIVFTGFGALNTIFTIDCPRCKEFNCTDLFLHTAPSKPEPTVSAWIRNLNEQGAEVPLINWDMLNDLNARLPDHSPREKQIILIQNIERMTKYPGAEVQLSPIYDITLAWASVEQEFIHYIHSLIDRGLLQKTDLSPYITDKPFSVAISADGWDYLEQHDRRIEERTQAFVAMSFSEDLKSVWEGPIYNAITKASYKPHRVDAEPHIDRIDVKIISEIKNSRFVVADITEQKRGVYFEAGYALGLGLPVIWCVRKDDLENAHFDTRQYNHIVWEKPEDLEEKLYDFICATIGRGKEA